MRAPGHGGNASPPERHAPLCVKASLGATYQARRDRRQGVWKLPTSAATQPKVGKTFRPSGTSRGRGPWRSCGAFHPLPRRWGKRLPRRHREPVQTGWSGAVMLVLSRTQPILPRSDPPHLGSSSIGCVIGTGGQRSLRPRTIEAKRRLVAGEETSDRLSVEISPNDTLTVAQVTDAHLKEAHAGTKVVFGPRTKGVRQ